MIDTTPSESRRGRPRLQRPRTRTVALKTDPDTAEAAQQYAADLGLQGASTLLHKLLTAELERSGRLPHVDATDADDGHDERLPAAS